MTVELSQKTEEKLVFENIAKKGWCEAKQVVARFIYVPMVIHQDPDQFLMFVVPNSEAWERFEDPVAYWIYKDGLLHCLKKPRR